MEQIFQAHEDLHRKYVVLENQEKQAVRRVNAEDRSHYTMLTDCLQPVLEEEWRMGTGFESLGDVVEELRNITQNPVNTSELDEKLTRIEPSALSDTASVGSQRGRRRRSSERSLGSVCSSRASSAESQAEGNNSRPSSRNRDCLLYTSDAADE